FPGPLLAGQGIAKFPMGRGQIVMEPRTVGLQLGRPFKGFRSEAKEVFPLRWFRTLDMKGENPGAVAEVAVDTCVLGKVSRTSLGGGQGQAQLGHRLVRALELLQERGEIMMAVDLGEPVFKRLGTLGN